MARRGTRNGRPLRFLAVTLGGWTAMRVVLLWPVLAVLPAARPVAPMVRGSGATVAATGSATIVGRRDGKAPLTPSAVPALSPPSPVARRSPPASVPSQAAVPAATPAQRGRTLASGALVPVDAALPVPPSPPQARASRLAGAAWTIVRGGGNGTLLGGQLGASQAGARLTYALGEARRLALSARLASPLRGRGREAAVGLDWQPTRLPLHLLAEQRVSLDGERGGPTLMLVGGVNPVPVLAGFRLEGYAQAGAIARDGVEAFGDGAVRLAARVAAIGAVRIDMGVGAWGAAQRGVRRLDLGPTVGAVVPVAGKALRVTLDWRERVAGNARPGSGPALSLGTDF